jgi:hypothetical protein
MLKAGDEDVRETNNYLNGALITGNKFTWNGIPGTSITHGLFLGYNINVTVKYNYFDKVPYGLVLKSGTDEGVNMTFTSGGAAYNIFKNGKYAVRIKGINGVKIYNNTFFNDQCKGECHFIVLTKNQDRAAGSPSAGTRIKNNIFYTKYSIPVFAIESDGLADFESDFNIYYCENNTNNEPIFAIDGVIKTWAQWRDSGYDLHSIIVNPDFIDTTAFVPSERLDYGTNLETTWLTGLSTTAEWGTKKPATADQNGLWQIGARVYPSSVYSPVQTFFDAISNPLTFSFQLFLYVLCRRILPEQK